MAARLPKNVPDSVLAGLGAAGQGILTARDATAAGSPGAASRVDLGRLLAGDHRDAVLDGRGHEFLTIRAAAGLRGDGRWEPDGLPKRSWADCLVLPSAWPTTAQDRPGRAQVGRGSVLQRAAARTPAQRAPMLSESAAAAASYWRGGAKAAWTWSAAAGTPSVWGG